MVQEDVHTTIVGVADFALKGKEVQVGDKNGVESILKDIEPLFIVICNSLSDLTLDHEVIPAIVVADDQNRFQVIYDESQDVNWGNVAAFVGETWEQLVLIAKPLPNNAIDLTEFAHSFTPEACNLQAGQAYDHTFNKMLYINHLLIEWNLIEEKNSIPIAQTVMDIATAEKADLDTYKVPTP